MTATIRALIVDDSEADAALLLLHLRRGGYQVVSTRVESADELRRVLADEPWDLVLCDYSMPSFEAPAAIAIVKEVRPTLPVIVVSGAVGEEAAVDCMRRGAHDYVVKDKLARLLPAVERELSETASRAEKVSLRERLSRSEDALVRSERLRALGQMAAGISHDLKNILNPLSLHLQLCERALKRGLPVHDDVAEMRAILARAVETIERLRDFSRQGLESKSGLVDLNAVVHEAVEISRPHMTSGARRMCTLREEFGSPPQVFAQSTDLVSAIVNLVVNAMDALPQGGNIAIRTGVDGPVAFVEVADNGPGISREIALRVFEPFFTTKGDEGTGLGLSMVFACMQRHGGQALFFPTPGGGATFRLELPLPAPSA